jgi:FLVCR family MFS transporter 7
VTELPAHPTPYRWVVLAVFSLLNVVTQLHWLALAPVTSEAATYYGVDTLGIGFLSMLFMAVYLFTGMPASYVLDTWGLRRGVGFGAVCIGVCALVKALGASNYTIVVAAQVGIAVGQPFVLNAYTRLGAKWFPIRERATATGVAALSQYVGIILAMALSPALADTRGIDGLQFLYGVATAAVAIVFLLLFREEPPAHPSEADNEIRLPFLAGIRHILSLRNMRIAIYLNFIGIGIFNSVNTWIEQIVAPRGFDSQQAGMVGAAIMAGGVLGALLLPPWSDRLRRRVPFLVVLTLVALPGLAGMTFATSYPLLLASACLFGFCTLGAGPIGFQYAAETANPAPESATQGLILTLGQISGIGAIYGMAGFTLPDGSMTPMLLVCMAATAGNVIGCALLQESRMLRRPES